MQSYPIRLTDAQGAVAFSAAADLFVYESGTNDVRTNLLTRSEADASTLGGQANVSTAATSVSGFDASIVVADNTLLRAAYRSAALDAGSTYVISVHVQMDDGSVPVPGTYNAGDLCMVADSNVAGGAVQVAATSKPGVYRLSVSFTASGGGTKNYGVIKYTTQTARGMRVTGFMLEKSDSGKATAYIRNITDAPASSTDGDTRIIVKPDSGSEITLRPGQRVRIADARASMWSVRSFDGSSRISGNVIIGSGEFDDANTQNTFKLDGTFTNAVKITNDTGARVPVTLDPGQTLNTNGAATLAYTGSYWNTVVRAAGAQQLVAPAANVNGIVLQRYSLAEFQNISGITNVSILAKASAPNNAFDGDVIDTMAATVNVPATMKSDLTQGVFRIPPGKGLYVYSDGPLGTSRESMFWQVL